MIEIDLIKKHGKKVLGMDEHAAHQPTWRQRLPEILLEIGIIVFAITLSIQLHAWHERSLNRTEAREFLLSLKTDLHADLVEMRQDSLAYVQRHRAYHYLLRVATQQATPDSLRQAEGFFYSTSNLNPNDSQFEGLKSAGKLGLIEDRPLLNLLLTLYQEQLPSLLSSTHGYSTFITDRLDPYLDEHQTKTNLPALLATERLQRYLRRGESTQEILTRYHLVMQISRALLRRIDQTQPTE